MTPQVPFMSSKTYACVLAITTSAWLSGVPVGAATEYLAPQYKPDPSVASILANVTPGHDAFPLEKTADELTNRLGEIGERLRAGAGTSEMATRFLSADFSGTPLRARRETALGKGTELVVFRSDEFANTPFDAAGFEKEWTGFLINYLTIETAEFAIVKIDGTPRDAATQAETVVAFDIVGRGKTAARMQKQGHWAIAWRKDDAGIWRIGKWTPLDQTRSQATHPVFTDVSMAAFGGNQSYRQQLRVGVDYWRTHIDGAFMPDVLGHNGVAVGDYDGDGRDDIFMGQAAGLPSRLFRNQGDGTFKDVSEEAGITLLDAVSTALFADVDNDGDEDLVVITFSQPLLFINDGKGHFTRRPGAFKLQASPKGYLTSAVMADYDRDGSLDLFVCSYSFFLGEGHYGLPTPYHDARNGPGNILFHNDGKGNFTDVTEAAGIAEGNDRFSFAAAFMDYDGDGWPDLAVANDFGRKTLYRNQGRSGSGPVRFKEVSAAAGVEDWASAGMSATWLDYNHDGRPDLYFSNMWSADGLRVTHDPSFLPEATADARAAFQRHARGNTLYQNNGDGTFKDVSLETHTEMGRWAWAADRIDFDGDGWDDLYIVNGLVTNEDPYSLDSFFWRQTVAESPLDDKPKHSFESGWKAINKRLRAHGTQAGHERNVFLRNNGTGSFDDISGSVGLDLDQDGRAFAVTDYDGDGDPDLVLASRSGPRLRLLRNDYRGAHATLAVRLAGKKSNRDGVGARVTVETDKDHYTQYVTAGSGFLSQRSKELLFGLGDATNVTKISVWWPSGQEQTFADVPIGQRVFIEEGGAAPVRTEPFAAASTPPAASANADEDPVAVVDALYHGTWLYRPYPAPDFSLPDAAGHLTTLSQLRGRPVLLVFGTAACATCEAQQKSLSEKASAFKAAGATVLTIAADPTGKPDGPAGRPRGLTALVANEPTVLTYSILDKYLFDRADEIVLPTTFLIDGKGDIVKIYRGRTDAAQILGDIPKIEAPAEERLNRALPFAGRFYGALSDRNYVQIGIELALQGADEAALTAFERAAVSSPGPSVFQNLGTLYMKKGDTARAKAAFREALARQSSFPEVSNSLGALLAQEGDPAGAVPLLRAAIDGKPDYADAMNNLGYTYLRMGRSDDALKLLEKALALQPDFAEALNNLGIYYGQVDGDLAKAEQYFRLATQKKPHYSEALNNLAMVLGTSGRAADAIKLLQDSIQDDPAFEGSYLTLCKLHLAAENRRAATQVLERLLQRNPKNPAALALLHELQGTPPK